MALKWKGSSVDQNAVFDRSGLDPSLGRGVYAQELRTAIVRVGFAANDSSALVRANSAEDLETQWAALHADLLRNVPSIVCTHFDERPDTTEHFRLIVGYASKTDEVVYHDPAVDNGAYLRMPRSRFLSLWPLKYQPDTWTLIRYALEPGNVLADAGDEPATSPANLAQHVMELRAKLRRHDFSIVVEAPFVVIGDEPEPVVRRHAQDTVRWAVTRLKRQFFARDPDKVLDIWLFRDKPSYDTNTLRLIGRKPSTPYGFYSSEHGALLMNIATGGGTLVHELVHPFIEANFPDCPPWLNEGLGSLYEQCEDNGGRIWGSTNWRLPSLQKAIRANEVPSFEALTSMDTTSFYDRDTGTNYAQARYLCFYLQEKGLLQRFYSEFLRDRQADPTGVGTLRRVLGQPDLAAFKAQWEQYVLGLRFR